MGDAREAEDVLQESYCRAFEALTHARFEGRSSLMTWLYRIVSNAALDALRSRARNQRPAENGGLDNVVSLPSVDGHLALRELSEWIADLRSEQRTALVLKELEGLTAAEVGQVMQCSEGAVEQHLVRARAILRARRQDG
jgi:RNA polymerase sigma-70 factor (ECF subfamily)